MTHYGGLEPDFRTHGSKGRFAGDRNRSQAFCWRGCDRIIPIACPRAQVSVGNGSLGMVT